MVGGGPFGLPPGAWTDDTSMALCLAESLIERRGFDPVDQLERYVRWYREGHWSSTGSCFDIGNATRARAAALRAHGRAVPRRRRPGRRRQRAADEARARSRWRTRATGRRGRATRPRARGRRTARPRPSTPPRYFAGLLVARSGAASEPCSARSSPRGSGTRTLAPEGRGGRSRLVPSRRRRRRSAGGGYVVDALEAALWALRTTTHVRGRACWRRSTSATTPTPPAAIYGQLGGRGLRARGHPGAAGASGC